MNATQAREYLAVAVATETGRDILRSIGASAVIDAPSNGDDRSTVEIAELVRAELMRRYKL